MSEEQEKELRKEFEEVVEHLTTNEAVADWWIAKLRSEREKARQIIVSKSYLMCDCGGGENCPRVKAILASLFQEDLPANK